MPTIYGGGGYGGVWDQIEHPQLNSDQKKTRHLFLGGNVSIILFY